MYTIEKAIVCFMILFIFATVYRSSTKDKVIPSVVVSKSDKAKFRLKQSYYESPKHVLNQLEVLITDGNIGGIDFNVDKIIIIIEENPELSIESLDPKIAILTNRMDYKDKLYLLEQIKYFIMKNQDWVE